MNSSIFINDFDYNLPPERIAMHPLAQRDASKLLVYRNGSIQDDTFSHLPHYLPADSTLVLNNTRVIEARIHFQKPTGGVVEIFCLEPYKPEAVEEAMQQTGSVQWRCLIGGASKWGHGQVLQKSITIHDKAIILEAIYVEKERDSFIIEFRWPGDFSFAEILHAAGSIPLPPYIKRHAEAEDSERYQTVFAEHDGSVAAPTAALHFTHETFKKLEAKNVYPIYLTLHVGAGTFKPVKTETIAEHQMHAERFSVNMDVLKSLVTAKSIVAVGTTSLRTLESLHWFGVKLLLHEDLKNFELGQWEAYDFMQHNFTYRESVEALIQYLQNANQHELHCRTSLLIQPGYQIKSAHALITNFHQPRSTLLLLVASFIGGDWKRIYQHALENDYRFLSYGDSSLLFSPLSPVGELR